MKKLLCFALLALFACVPLVHAVPSLGVATDTREYAYTGAEPTDEYIHYFADTLFPATNGYEGFVVGASGSHLIVFTSYNPSQTDVYLLSNTGGDNFPITFGGQTLTDEGDIGQIDGYVNPSGVYYGRLLPTTLSSWTTHEFSNKTYYLYDAPLTYTGTLSLGDYFFSVADTNGEEGLQFGSGKKDDFSPKTSSAVGNYTDHNEPVPEPGTMLLLTTGLAGLGGFRVFRKRS